MNSDSTPAVQSSGTKTALPEESMADQFESRFAKMLQYAWMDGWAHCRDAEFIGDEAMQDEFNGSATLALCLSIDHAPESASPPSTGQEAPSDAKDAMRYRWLRQCSPISSAHGAVVIQWPAFDKGTLVDPTRCLWGGELDAAIDAAIASCDSVSGEPGSNRKT